MGKNILRTDRLILIIAAILLVLPLTVSAVDITVDSITPNMGVNTDNHVSLVITGTNFTGIDEAGLYNISMDYSAPPSNFNVVSDTEINVDVDLTSCGTFEVCQGEMVVYTYVNDPFSFIWYPDITFTVTSESEPTPTPTPTETIRALIINPSVESESFFCRIIYTKWICDLGGAGTGGMGPQGIPGINGTVGTGDTNYFNFTGSNLTTISNITNFYNSTISNFTVISNITNFYNETFYNGTSNQTDIDLTSYPFLNGTRTLTGIWNFGGYNISNLLDPVSAQDAATKNYVDTHGGTTFTLCSNLSMIYPVNSVIINTDNVSPATKLGCGNWNSLGTGYVLVGV
jgi:hypothetical protein